MRANPLFAYRSPWAPAIDMVLTLHSGAAVQVRGVAAMAETTTGETAATWAKSGPAVWVSWDGDTQAIETVGYLDPATGERVERRATFAERVAGTFGWNTIRVVLSRQTIATTQTDYSSQDYSPLDYG